MLFLPAIDLDTTVGLRSNTDPCMIPRTRIPTTFDRRNFPNQNRRIDPASRAPKSCPSSSNEIKLEEKKLYF
jgi:hypothetical protein